MYYYNSPDFTVESTCLIMAQFYAYKMIEEIGQQVGWAADAMVASHYRLYTLRGKGKKQLATEAIVPLPFDPVLEAPHLDPDLVWNLARAYWHEIVYRGMEIGKNEAFWITGIEEFSYDEVLVFAQHIWLAFKKVTGLDFTIPSESASVKFWLGLSEKLPGREHAPDTHNDTIENKRSRLMQYIDRGGPSRRLMEKTRDIEPLPDDGYYLRNYEDMTLTGNTPELPGCPPGYREF